MNKRIRSIKTKIVGISHTNPDGIERQDLASRLVPGEELLIKRDIMNKHDKFAIALFNMTGAQLGFIGADFAESLSADLDKDKSAYARVINLSGGEEGERIGCNIEIFLVDLGEPRPF